MKVDVHDDKDKKKAMKVVSSLQGNQSDLFLCVYRTFLPRKLIIPCDNRDRFDIYGHEGHEAHCDRDR